MRGREREREKKERPRVAIFVLVGIFIGSGWININNAPRRNSKITVFKAHKAYDRLFVKRKRG